MANTFAFSSQNIAQGSFSPFLLFFSQWGAFLILLLRVSNYMEKFKQSDKYDKNILMTIRNLIRKD